MLGFNFETVRKVSDSVGLTEANENETVEDIVEEPTAESAEAEALLKYGPEYCAFVKEVDTTIKKLCLPLFGTYEGKVVLYEYSCPDCGGGFETAEKVEEMLDHETGDEIHPSCNSCGYQDSPLLDWYDGRSSEVGFTFSPSQGEIAEYLAERGAPESWHYNLKDCYTNLSVGTFFGITSYKIILYQAIKEAEYEKSPGEELLAPDEFDNDDILDYVDQYFSTEED
jgi:uncharacterized protein YfiM (DUF2279 family)